MRNKLRILPFLFLLISCTPSTEKETKTPETKPSVTVPSFNEDSAYVFIEQQVAFGPRVPGTKEHEACATWIKAKLKSYGASVFVQSVSVRAYNGTMLPCKNIIASFYPEKSTRVMLSAHWDTRHIADNDQERTTEPILGANDGGSGVGVLLEIARLLESTPSNVGIDIILFDCEDYGDSGTEDSYCLGSQAWGKNPPVKGYAPKFAINLDMVGAKGAVFPQEQISMDYASAVVNKVWNRANQLGYGNYFLYRRDNAITDDHYYVNVLAGIPAIDIIHYDSETNVNGFADYWHTHKDNMDIISKNTLKAVGETITHVIYEE